MAKSRRVCGNDPRAQLTEGDRKAVAAFEAFLASKKQLAEEIPVFAREITRERLRQLETFGDQRHPDLDPQSYTATDRESYALEAQRWQRLNALRARDGRTAWDGILLEEVYEALGEDDPAKLRTELVQTAAVIAAWISDLDRRPTEGTS